MPKVVRERVIDVGEQRELERLLGLRLDHTIRCSRQWISSRRSVRMSFDRRPYQAASSSMAKSRYRVV